MTCRDVADFLDRYIAGDLPAETRCRFERHLSGCRNCERYLAQYRDAIALGRAAYDDLTAPVPRDVPEALIAAILAARVPD